MPDSLLEHMANLHLTEKILPAEVSYNMVTYACEQ